MNKYLNRIISQTWKGEGFLELEVWTPMHMNQIHT